jgi:S-formylglutathione hydrolase FrmB
MKHKLLCALVGLAVLNGGVLIAAVLPSTVAPAAAAPTITLQNGDGITVDSSYWVDPRLMDVTVSSAALPGPVGVRVLLPNGYDPTQATRYPVLYLLHGGFGSYTDWTTFGNVEPLTVGLPVIVVMPDGGQGGWYSNWANFGAGGPPQWETFHINQLIPWIDANFSTIASKAGRAIAGLSMGGFGAMTYAAQFPGLFTSVSSYSGALDDLNPGVEQVIEWSPVVENGLPGAIFGVTPSDVPGLTKVNPVNLAANLAGDSHIALYTGNGIAGPLDGTDNPQNGSDNIQEAFVYATNVAMNQALTNDHIAHSYNYYGNGTHSWPYWNRDLAQDLPGIMGALAPATPTPPPYTPPPPPPSMPVPAGNVTADPGFESAGMGPWHCSGQCGIDQGLGNGHSGANNGWVRNTTGWNDIDQTVTVAPNTYYTLTGWVRTSSDNSAGYFGVRDTSGNVINETEYNALNGYTDLSVSFYSGSHTSVVVYGGFWAQNQDTWMQMDDVFLTPSSAPPNVVNDPGFEAGGLGPWSCAGQCGVDQGLGNAFSGSNNGWVRNASGWNDLEQTVSVKPNTVYTLTGWLRTSSNNSAGYFGVRDTSGNVIGQDGYNALNGYTQLTVSLNTGNNSSVVVFGGLWPQNGDTWMQLDDVSLMPG